MGVIDALELIQIENKEGHRFTITGYPLQLLGHALMEWAIQQLGQAIHGGHRMHFLVPLAPDQGSAVDLGLWPSTAPRPEADNGQTACFPGPAFT